MSNRRYNAGKWIARAVAAAPPLALLICIAVYLGALKAEIVASLPQIGAAAAGSALHRQVRVGTVTVSAALTRMTVHDVAISNAATFAGGGGRSVASAKLVVVDLSPIGMLRDPSNAASYISSVQLVAPRVYVERFPNHRFNFSSLFTAKHRPNAKPFQGLISVSEGVAVFRDHLAPEAVQPAINTVRDVNGQVSFAAPFTTIFVASGTGSPNRALRGRVSGTIQSSRSLGMGKSSAIGYLIRVSATQANAAYFTRYFLASMTQRYAAVEAGKADVEMSFAHAQSSKAPLDISGMALAHNVDFVVRDRKLVAVPIEHANGNVWFTNRSLAVAMDATLAGMAASITGNAPELSRGYAAFSLTAPRVNAPRLHAALPFIPRPPSEVDFPAALSVKATAIGPISDLQYSAAISTPLAHVYGIDLTGVRAAVRFQGKTFRIDSLLAGVGGGSGNLQAYGSSSIGGAGTVLRARLSRVDLARVRLPAGLAPLLDGVSGELAADVDVSTTRPLGTRITARLRSGSVHGIPVAEAVATIETDGKRAAISRFSAIQPDGATVSAAGSAPLSVASHAPYDLNVAAAGVDVNQIGQEFGQRRLSGSAYFRGKVAGPAGRPAVSGQLSVFDAGYGTYRLDRLAANVKVEKGAISATDAVASRLGVTVRGSGSITDIGLSRPELHAKLAMRGAEIAGVDELIEQEPASQAAKRDIDSGWIADASGSLDAQASVDGPTADPTAKFAASVSSASYAGIDVSKCTITGGYSGGVLRVTNAAATIAGAGVTGGGQINLKTNAIQAQAVAESIDLATLARLSGLEEPVSGTAEARVAATGTLADPTIALQCSVPSATYRNVQLSVQKVILTYHDAIVTNDAKPFVIVSGPATYTVTGLRYDLAHRDIDISAGIAGERIARLVGAARDIAPPKSQDTLDKIPAGIDGALDVRALSVSGALNDPSVHLTATIGGFTVGGDDSEKLDFDVDAGYSHGVVAVSRLDGRGASAYISASGEYGPAGPLRGRLDASNIPLSMLAHFAPRDLPLGGEIRDLTVVATGDAAHPVINSSVSLTDVALGSVVFDRIDSGRITLAGGRITIAGVTLTKTEHVAGGEPVVHVATIRGFLPFDLSLHGGLSASLPSDQSVSLTADLPQQSVSLLSEFAPALRPDNLQGTIAAHLAVGGTFADKRINGALVIANGSVAAPGLKTSFRNINLDAEFTGTRGTITSSRIESSAGGYVTVSGGIAEQSQTGAPRYTSAANALLGDLKLDLTLDSQGFTISEPKISALYNAGFQGVLNGRVSVSRDLLKPLISGNLQIANAVGILPRVSANQTPSTRPPVFDPQFELAVSILRGGRLRSSQIDASADGAFNIAGSLYRPDITGDLYLRSGRFSFPTAIFRIVPTGDVHFVYNPPEDAIEQVNIAATTDLTISPAILTANPVGVGATSPFSYQPPASVQAGGSLPQRYTVTLTIDGDLNSPNGPSLSFDSDPPGLTSSEILAALGGQQALNTLLVGGNVQLALQTEAQQILTSYAIPTLLQPVEANIATAFGVEEFNVNYEPQSPLSISVTKQVGTHLDVSYTRYINSRIGGAVSSTLEPLEYTLSVNYDFTNRFRVGLSTDDQHNNEIEIGGALRF